MEVLVYIKEIQLVNFMNHVNSIIKLSEALTCIVGPNDNGKSVIIYAIRWFSRNEPRGSNIISTFNGTTAPFCKVKLIMEDDTIFIKTRTQKGGTSFECPTWKKSWEKSDIPKEISDIVGIYPYNYGLGELDLNFSFQLDSPFMLSEAASMSANVISHFTGTELLDQAIKVIDKENWNLNHVNNLLADKLKLSEKSKQKYSFLEKSVKELNAAKEFYALIQSKAKLIESLTALKTSYLKSINNYNILNKKLNVLITTEAEEKVKRAAVNLTFVGTLQEIGVNYFTAEIIQDKLIKKQLQLSTIENYNNIVTAFKPIVINYTKLVEASVAYSSANTIFKKSKNKVALLNDFKAIYIEKSIGKVSELIYLKATNSSYNATILSKKSLATKLEENKKEKLIIANKLDVLMNEIGSLCPLCNHQLKKGDFYEHENSHHN